MDCTPTSKAEKQKYNIGDIVKSTKCATYSIKGKIVEITGIVDGIDSDIDDKAVVRLSDGDEFSFDTVTCYIDDENQDKACELEKGQNVTIVGEADGEVIGRPHIKDCKIK